MTCTDFEPPIQFQSRIEKLPRWSTDDMNPSQLVKFSLKSSLGRKVAVGFAPAQEVMCGSAGCYANQFQLDRFLDHLTVIIKRQKKGRHTTKRHISLNKKTKRQPGMVESDDMNPSQLVQFSLKKILTLRPKSCGPIRASAGGYERQRRMLCYTIPVGPISRSPIGDNKM